LPAGIDRVLRRGLARSAEDRAATVEAFRHDLISALQGGAARGRRLVSSALLVLCPGVVALTLGSRYQPEDTSQSPDAEAARAWIVHDRAGQLRWFDRGGTESDDLVPERLLVRGQAPRGRGA